jgi:hypothetical protein
MRVRAIALLVAAGLAPAAVAGGDRTIVGRGVQVVAPAGWTRVASAGDGSVIDPRTVLVVGTAGVRPRPSGCQIAGYRVQPAGAVVVSVRWRTVSSAGGRPPRGRAPLRRLAVRRPSFECFQGLGGAAQLVLGSHAYQVNVMVGDRAPAQVVREALSVARSFDIAR